MTLQSDAVDTFKEMNERMNAIKLELKEKGEELFKGAMRDYFDRNPLVTEVQFGGYTPFFNDGDECIFRMTDYLTKINGFSVGEDARYDNEAEDNPMFPTYYGPTGKQVESYKYNYATRERETVMVDEYDDIPNPNYNPEWDGAVKDLNDLINSVDDTTFKDIFGSHFLVTATRDKVEVEEYLDHD